MTEEEIYVVNHEYEIAVRNLNSQAWNVMLPSEKIHDLQAIENKSALDQGRLACEVRAEPMDQGRWGYQEGLQIVVNSNELDNPNFMEHVNTIYHEGSHARDWQGQYITEVRNQYTPGQLAERNSPVPDPSVDPAGYWNHPSETAARQAGEEGVGKTRSDREHIIAVDRRMHETRPMNQILETHDYIALGTPVQTGTAESEPVRGTDMPRSPGAGRSIGSNASPHIAADAGLGTGPNAGPSPGPNAGLNAGLDAGLNAGLDAGLNAGPDAGLNAGPDAGPNAGSDAGPDAGPDTGPDIGSDTGPDAGLDDGPDEGNEP